MKRFLIVFIILPVSLMHYGQIIADHTVVDKYDEIPQEWIDEVKKMQLDYSGASHAGGVLAGLNALESLNSAYQAETADLPMAYSSSYLRACRHYYIEGWWGGLGPSAWYNTPSYRQYMKNGLTYINETYNTPLSVVGLGWSYTPDYVAADMATYVEATDDYNTYSLANGYDTKFIFTTGIVDGDQARGEIGWVRYLAHEAIRDSVDNDPTRILFDYADILCYDDDGSGPNTNTWDGNTYPTITDLNKTPSSPNSSHISSIGEMRLAKAIWWMLARIAGWDGTVNGEDSTPPSVPADISAPVVSESAVEISWSSANDNVGVASYNVYRDGVLLANIAFTSYTDNTVSTCTEYTYIVTALDAAGNESNPSSALTVSTCTPDLAPTLIVTPNISHGVTNFDVIVRVTELNQASTHGTITVQFAMDDLWGLDGGFNNLLTTLDGMPLDNSDWAYSSDSNNHIFTSSTNISAGGFSTFGFSITFNPDTSGGLYTITSQLVPGSGGETRSTNNSDSEKLDYFL